MATDAELRHQIQAHGGGDYYHGDYGKEACSPGVARTSRPARKAADIRFRAIYRGLEGLLRLNRGFDSCPAVQLGSRNDRPPV
jgi:hypothetical protein